MTRSDSHPIAGSLRDPGPGRPGSRRDPAIVIVVAVALLVALISAAVSQPLDNDEHQFIAPAVLIAQGDSPYVDFPTFHLPGQAYLYAGVARLFDQPFLAARLLNALAAWLTAGVLFIFARSLVKSPWMALCIAVMPVLAWSSPYTVGRSWNHAIPTLIAATSLALAVIGLERRNLFVIALSGLCLGAAVTMRITWLPLGLPFGVALIFVNNDKHRARTAALRLLVFAAGVAVTWVPLGLLIADGFETFRYGSIEYPRIDRRMFIADGRNTALWRRIASLAALVLREPAGIVLVVGFVGALVQCAGRRGKSYGSLIFCAAVVLFVAWGAVAPTRVHQQYVYTVLVFIAMALPVAYAYAIRGGVERRKIAGPLTIAAAVVVIAGLPVYVMGSRLLSPADWTPTRVAAAAEEIASHVGAGKVMTLTPLLPAVGGAGVYRPFAVGAYGWRSAHQAPAELREAAGIVGPDELDALLAENPPAAVLVGLEGGEQPLIDWAGAHGFHPVALEAMIPYHEDEPKQLVLWVEP